MPDKQKLRSLSINFQIEPITQHPEVAFKSHTALKKITKCFISDIPPNSQVTHNMLKPIA
jgi:hypothetical protein